MSRTPLEEAVALTVADVLHQRFSALPADATIGQVREWFDESSHRRIAVLSEGQRYAGWLSREDIAGDVDPLGPAAALAGAGPTVAPDAPAHVAYELATATSARRVPVVDHDGILVGVVGVTDDLGGFCGTK